MGDDGARALQQFTEGGACVWGPPPDGNRVADFLRDWLAERGHLALTDSDVKLDRQHATVTLATDGGPLSLRLDLGVTCATPPVVTLTGPWKKEGFPLPGDLDALGRGFPVPRLLVGQDPASGGTPAGLGPGHVSLSLSLVVSLLVAVLAAGPERRRMARPLLVGTVSVAALALVALAAWPLLFKPFVTDAPVLRAAYAALDAFGDWNHPFLPYLLSRPVARVTLEPSALRLLPLVALATETALMVLAATRAGGPLAGALSGAWFAWEVRRRHGLIDLGDWDFAGAFLVALLLWTQHPPRSHRLKWVGVAGLLVGGVFSSWLMIVPAGVLVSLLVVDALGGRMPRAPVAALGAVFCVLGALALSIFVRGRLGGPGHSEGILGEIYRETPVARAWAMAIPIVLGTVWLVRRWRDLDARFVFATLVTVPVAVYESQRHSHVNGGYYVGLVTPLLLTAAAAGTARSVTALGVWLAGPSPSRPRAWATAGARCALLLVLVHSTLLPGLQPVDSEVDRVQILAREVRRDALPILTNSRSLPRLLAYERARAREGPVEDIIVGAPTVEMHVRQLDDETTCAPRDGTDGLKGGFYLAYFRQARGPSARACAQRYGEACEPLASSAWGTPRGESVAIFRCTGVPPPQLERPSPPDVAVGDH
jgi:hypothetical protein